MSLEMPQQTSDEKKMKSEKGHYYDYENSENLEEVKQFEEQLSSDPK